MQRYERTKMYSIKSPATQADFAEFMKTNPDLYAITDWMKNNISTDNLIDYDVTDPGDLFSYLNLEKWAIKNNFKYSQQIEDFPEKELEQWAKDHDFVKKYENELDENYGIPKMIRDSNSLFVLNYKKEKWIIQNSQTKEIYLSADYLWELNDLANDYLKKHKELPVKRGRGRPKGSKNKNHK